MKIRQEVVTRREGENMGRIIGSNYPYDKHDLSCTIEPQKTEDRNKQIAMIEEIERLFLDGKKLRISYDPMLGGDLVDIGMYDGWPYWEPTPALLLRHWHGCEWHFWNDICSYKLIDED